MDIQKYKTCSQNPWFTSTILSLWCRYSGWQQLFGQYHHFNENTFYEFLKEIHHKFPKCYLFLNKAPQHHRSGKVRKYFEEHKDSLMPKESKIPQLGKKMVGNRWLKMHGLTCRYQNGKIP
jgi:hypothetical protein